MEHRRNYPKMERGEDGAMQSETYVDKAMIKILACCDPFLRHGIFCEVVITVPFPRTFPPKYETEKPQRDRQRHKYIERSWQETIHNKRIVYEHNGWINLSKLQSDLCFHKTLELKLNMRL